MPLSELSNNVRRSASNARDKASTDAGSASAPSVPPSAVQSMLRTTTELGDIGPFASRPFRLPRSSSRLQSTRPRSGSYDASSATGPRHQLPSHIRRPGRHHGPRPIASSSGFSGRNTSQSNLSSYTSTSRRRRYPPGPHPYPLQGLGSPAPGPRGLYTHRSLVTLRSHSSVPSNSPMMHPVPMRRPGHRTSSPAPSDMPSMAPTPRPGFLRAPSVGTVASSPASMFPQHPGLLGYRHDLSASYTSLVRLPSPAVSFPRNGPYPGPIPLRTPTPSAMVYRQHHGRASDASLAGIPNSPTGSTVPQYYDYSESFIEEDCFSPDGAQGTGQPPHTLDETVLEGVPSPPPRHAQTPFGTIEGSTFHPVELPTEHNRRPSEQSRRSFNGVVPKRVSSLGTTALHKSSPEIVNTRRARSEDSGPSDNAKVNRDARRSSLVSRRSCTPSSSSIFLPNAARSSRDLTTLAARVHSPPVDSRQRLARCAIGTPKLHEAEQSTSATSRIAVRSPRTTLPTFTFRPISFEWYSPSPSARPRTSEAAPIRKTPEILSPMPERSMSSQSRNRFSKILEIEDTFDDPRGGRINKPFSWLKPLSLKKVDEASDHRHSMRSDGTVVSTEVGSQLSSRALEDSWTDPGARVSQVTSHDKSTIESLLDKHIECLGLQPEPEVDSDETTDLQDRQIDCLSSEEDTIRLTDLLATVPTWEKRRPMTSSSHRHSSLATLERHRLRPRRLFASMDARVPKTVSERPTPAFSTDSETNSKVSRPSYGWQTLPSTSQLASGPSTIIPSITSGELGDIDSSNQQMKFKVRRRSNMSQSTSVSSHLSKSSGHVLAQKKQITPRRRSKSEVFARQESHRRRHMCIRLRLKTKSKTVVDLSIEGVADFRPGEVLKPQIAMTSTRSNGIKSPMEGYAELSGDSIMPSKPASPRTRSPPIPTRWSSIMAAMPEPVKRGAEVVRKASIRTNRSHRSHTSIVEPVNSSRLDAPLPQLGSVPRLAPPEFGPPLTSSDLNLSLPYAEIASTIRPTLRETKSFFSDDSSAHRQRTSIRQKLHLHSLRHVLPGPAGHSPLANVKLSHSCQIRGRKSDEGDSSLPEETVLTSEFAYRKRKMLERLKDWWRRQCMSRVRRRKGERRVPGGVGW